MLHITYKSNEEEMFKGATSCHTLSHGACGFVEQSISTRARRVEVLSRRAILLHRVRSTAKRYSLYVRFSNIGDAVTFDGNRYSVPVKLASETLTIKGYARTIKIY